MDLTVELEDNVLNIRSACIINHCGKILVHKNINHEHYALIGGRVMIGENSKDTIIREIYEELGKEIKITEYISTIENFYIAKGKKYHEIMFIYKAEFVDEKDKFITEPIPSIENKPCMVYEWIDIEKIDEYNIKPIVIKDVLRKGKFPLHVINNDLNDIKKGYII